MNLYISIDVETTGLGKQAEIIEIAAIKIKNDNITDRFHTFVNITESLSQEITNLTGITDNDLIGAPDIKTALLSLKNFIGDMTIIGYNAAFDMFHIKHYCDENGISFDNEVIDVLIMAREKLFDTGIISNYRLSTVAEYFGIILPWQKENEVRRAVGTAEVNIEIYKRLQEIR